MSTYAIGDIQGCYKTLKRLLKRINFDYKQDKLWFAGDLINRGPKSLDVLRFAKDLGDQAICVLGNHEIFLLALYLGVLTRENTKSLDPILKAKDSHELFNWVRHRPLMHVQHNAVLVHAGLLPCWSVKAAQQEANAIQKLLQSDEITDFLVYAYAHQDTNWKQNLKGFERYALALHTFVHMRLCSDAHTIRFGFTGEPKDAPEGTKPWYLIPKRRNSDHTILFGHWSALGLRAFSGCIALDSGCIWGGQFERLPC